MAAQPPNIHRENPKGWYQPIVAHGVAAPYNIAAWQSGLRFRATINNATFALPDVGANGDDIWSIFHVQADEGITGVTVDVTDVTPVGTTIYYKGADKGTSVTIPPGRSLTILAMSSARWEVVSQIGVFESDTVLEAARGEVWVDEQNGDDVLGDGSPSNPYATFWTAYTAAQALSPGGQAKSTTNRAVVRFRKGFYDIGKSDRDLADDYIDLVGEGRCLRNQYSLTSTEIEYPDVILSANGYKLAFSFSDCVLRSITFEQKADAQQEKACIELHEHAMANVFFKDVGFRAGTGNLGTVRAVVQDRTAGNVWNYARFEDCHTTLTGFLFNGYWRGNAVRCSADDYSFCGFDTASAYSDPTGGEIHNKGYMEDCWSGDYSFGALNGDIAGGHAECSGTKWRCFGLTYCFGAVNGANEVMDAECGGSLIQCHGTTNSFGYSKTGAATCSANLLDCSSQAYCFGCSAAVNGQLVPYVGLFSGAAYRTISTGGYCFGSNAADVTGGDVDAAAVLEDCQATTCSFGARGAGVNGTFRRCKAGTASFGQATAPQTALLMDGCEITDIAAGEEPIFDGVATLIRCKIKVTAQVDEASVGINDDGPRLYDCDFYGSGSTVNVAYTGNGLGANIKMAHCRMNVGIDATLTNDIDSGYNVVDGDYIC